MGAGLGAALVGTRPIIEMRIFDFVMCAMDELVNQIAKVRYMFGGQAKPAVVVRMPHGMWRNSAAQHSQMLEAWFAHLPGVVVVTPATAADTAGLLVQAIRSRRSGAVLRSEGSVRTATGEIGEPIEPIPFGVARKVARRRCRHGGDLVGGGAGRDRSGASSWPGRGSRSISRPAHDLAVGRGRGGRVGAARPDGCWSCMRPWRSRASAPRWWRAWSSGSARAALKAAKRLAAPRIPVPFAPPLEAEVRVTPEKVVRAVQSLVD